jgi:hypothetical protein
VKNTKPPRIDPPKEAETDSKKHVDMNSETPADNTQATKEAMQVDSIHHIESLSSKICNFLFLSLASNGFYAFTL